MDIDGLPVIGSGVDYTQIGAIPQKHTWAFMNHFITNTVSFLNKFSRSCEIRLQKCESRIQKLEASLCILEAKLTSIPALDDKANLEAVILPKESASDNVIENIVEALPSTPATNPVQEENTDSTTSKPIPDGMVPAIEDPVYKRFFRMVHVGVPEPAVRLKMQAEGLNPNILSNPNLLVPSSPAAGSNSGSASTD